LPVVARRGGQTWRSIVSAEEDNKLTHGVGGVERRLRDEMQTGFDAVAGPVDRLETEYHMLVAGLKRVDERLEPLSDT
jgi:hypothetical protein